MDTSRRNWGNGFAIGLVVGAGLLIFAMFFWYGPVCNPDYPCGYPRDDQPHNGSIWYDTMAQWIAAGTGVAVGIFTFITILLVRQALTADNAALDEAKAQTEIARKALQDSREIGEAQVRAYIYANSADIDPEGDTIGIIFKNFGSSPGSVSFIDCHVHVYDPYATKKLWDQSFWSDGFTLAPQDTARESFKLDRGRGRYLKEMIAADGVYVCVQGQFQSVDVFKHTHQHGINVVLSDGIRA